MSKKFIGTHWGTYTHEKNNNKPKLNYWSKDLNPTKFGLDFINAAQDNLRINQPYIRKGWLEKNKTSRGKDIFIPVSWNKAISCASKELLKIKKRYGNESIYAGSYGWASAGRFHHAKSQLNRFFNLFGGFSHSVQSYSYAAAQTILPHVIGKSLYELLDDHTSWNALSKKTEFLINPTGKFVIGGPQGDAGLTGCKIITDTYGGWARHGGGAFSGKDPSKVDRSAAYMTRWVAKNIVEAGLATAVEIQVAYAIGHPHPTSIHVDTFGSGKISDKRIVSAVKKVFSFKPADIIKQLNLLRPIYRKTTNYGHFAKKGLPWEDSSKAKDLLKAI